MELDKRVNVDPMPAERAVFDCFCEDGTFWKGSDDDDDDDDDDGGEKALI